MALITSLITKIAIVALFLGVLSSMAVDILGIIANPVSITPWKVFVIDIANIVTNSQNTISKSIDAFAEADETFKTFLVWRIMGSSVVTLIFIWAIWKGLGKLVPGHTTDLGTKMIVFIMSILIVWVIGLVASILSGQGVPSFFGFYHGWINLILKREVFVQYLIKAIAHSG